MTTPSSEVVDDLRQAVSCWQCLVRLTKPGTRQRAAAKKSLSYYEDALSAASHDAFQRQELSDAVYQAERAYWTIDGEPVETPAERDAEIAHYAKSMAAMSAQAVR